MFYQNRRLMLILMQTSLRQKTVCFLFQFLVLANVFVDCADTAIIRTPSRRELLYPRSRIATAAKAFGLKSIDMVRTFSYRYSLYLNFPFGGLHKLQRL